MEVSNQPVRSYVVLDIETTGLHPKIDKITEIGAVKVINGKALSTYETFVNAGKRISPEITKLTGITEAMAADGKKPSVAIRELAEFCEDLPLLGHNIMFDYSFLVRLAENEKVPFQKNGLDTLKIARKHLKHLEKRSLEYLCGYYGISRVHSHRAFDDAQATGILYEKMAAEFYTEEDKVFQPQQLTCKVKKQGPVTPAQKRYLKELLKYHKIEIDMEIDDLTKSEASRYIDRIISQYGKRMER